MATIGCAMFFVGLVCFELVRNNFASLLQWIRLVVNGSVMVWIGFALVLNASALVLVAFATFCCDAD